MALTPSERTKRWRERQKAERETVVLAAKEKLRADYQTSFDAYYWDHGESSNFDLYLALAGYEAPDFSDGMGPEAHALPDAIEGIDDPFGYIWSAEEKQRRGGKVPFEEFRNPSAGALERAEVLIGCFSDAAQSLAQIVSDYKQGEIKARIAEVETSDLSDAATRKAAMAEIVRLNKVLDQLGKRVRYSLPQWKVEGV